MLAIPCEDTGFIRPLNDALDTAGTIRPGIYVAGTVTAPRRYPGQCRVRRIGSDPGIYRCGKDAIGVKGQDGSATLWWDAGAGCLRYIEQTLLPNELVVVECPGHQPACNRDTAPRDPGCACAGCCRGLWCRPCGTDITRSYQGAIHGERAYRSRNAQGPPARLPSTLHGA